jgi:predicted amidohydrolase YtcJ
VAGHNHNPGTVGKFAGLVVLDRDYFCVSNAEARKERVREALLFS